MLFLTYDPYNDNFKENNSYTNEDEELNECFICYEITIEKDEEPIKLEKQRYYLKKCTCLGFVHKTCLDIWFDKTHKCPICREIIVENHFYIGEIKYIGPYLISFYLLYRRHIYRFLRVCFVTMFFYFVIELYYSIIVNKMIRDKYYDYDYYYYNNFAPDNRYLPIHDKNLLNNVNRIINRNINMNEYTSLNISSSKIHPSYCN